MQAEIALLTERCPGGTAPSSGNTISPVTRMRSSTSLHIHTVSSDDTPWFSLRTSEFCSRNQTRDTIDLCSGSPRHFRHPMFFRFGPWNGPLVFTFLRDIFPFFKMTLGIQSCVIQDRHFSMVFSRNGWGKDCTHCDPLFIWPTKLTLYDGPKCCEV